MSIFKSIWIGVLAATVINAHSHDGQAVQELLASGTSCEHSAYKSHIISKSPLVIYLDGFLTSKEAAHLQAVT
jgi:prolyl 4-hydroxylase